MTELPRSDFHTNIEELIKITDKNEINNLLNPMELKQMQNIIDGGFRVLDGDGGGTTDYDYDLIDIRFNCLELALKQHKLDAFGSTVEVAKVVDTAQAYEDYVLKGENTDNEVA